MFDTIGKQDYVLDREGRKQPYGKPQINKWDLDELKGVEVINDNPTSNKGVFTSDDLDYIRKKLTENDGAKIFFNGRDVDIQIDNFATSDSEKHYEVREDKIYPDKGWIVVAPSHDIYGLANALRGSDINGNIDKGIIKLDTKKDYTGEPEFRYRPRTIAHEIGHIMVYNGGNDTDNEGHTYTEKLSAHGGHTHILKDNQSIMSVAPGYFMECHNPCMADKKAFELVYEDSFNIYSELEDIVGTEFYD